MSAERDLACLVDMVRAGRDIAEFIEGMDEQAFLKDRKTISAVQHQLMIMGEAVKLLSPDLSGFGPCS